MEVKRTERGWAGHFICSNRCNFRRNTLIEYGNKKWVVSTVGALIIDGNMEEVGCDRWYETMAFEAHLQDGYWDADVEKEIYFDSPWGINSKTVARYGKSVDNIANDMHEAVVAELMEKITERE